MNNFLPFTLEVAQKTGAELMKHFAKAKPVTRGTAKDIKSFFDKLADRKIKQAIIKKFPKHSFLTEETGHVKKEKKYLWIVDPIDGTGNFVNGNPLFGISIALWINDEPVIGVISAPALNETYFAVKNKGAWLLKNNKKRRLRVSDVSDLSQSYLVYCDGGYPDKSKIIKNVADLYPKTKDIRKIGSAACELIWVAIGRAEAYFSPCLSIWDIAAGILIVKEAGGQILDFQNKPQQFSKMLKMEEIDILATNGKIKMPEIKI